MAAESKRVIALKLYIDIIVLMYERWLVLIVCSISRQSICDKNIYLATIDLFSIKMSQLENEAYGRSLNTNSRI